MDQALDTAKASAGGPSGLAARLVELNPAAAITPRAVSQWKRVLADRVIDFERITRWRELSSPGLANIARSSPYTANHVDSRARPAFPVSDAPGGWPSP